MDTISKVKAKKKSSLEPHRQPKKPQALLTCAIMQALKQQAKINAANAKTSQPYKRLSAIDVSTIIRSELYTLMGIELSSVLEQRMQETLSETMQDGSPFMHVGAVENALNNFLTNDVLGNKKASENASASKYDQLLARVNELQTDMQRNEERAKENFQILQDQMKRISAEILAIRKKIKKSFIKRSVYKYVGNFCDQAITNSGEVKKEKSTEAVSLDIEENTLSESDDDSNSVDEKGINLIKNNMNLKHIINGASTYINLIENPIHGRIRRHRKKQAEIEKPYMLDSEPKYPSEIYTRRQLLYQQRESAANLLVFKKSPYSMYLNEINRGRPICYSFENEQKKKHARRKHRTSEFSPKQRAGFNHKDDDIDNCQESGYRYH